MDFSQEKYSAKESDYTVRAISSGLKEVFPKVTLTVHEALVFTCRLNEGRDRGD